LKGGIPFGAIIDVRTELDQGTLSENSEREFQFRTDKKLYFMRARNKEERDKWVEALKNKVSDFENNINIVLGVTVEVVKDVLEKLRADFPPNKFPFEHDLNGDSSRRRTIKNLEDMRTEVTRIKVHISY